MRQLREDRGEALAKGLGEVTEKFERWDRLQLLGAAGSEWTEFRQELTKFVELVREVDYPTDDMV